MISIVNDPRPGYPRAVAFAGHAMLWEIAPSIFTLNDQRCPRACAPTVARFTPAAAALDALRNFDTLWPHPHPLPGKELTMYPAGRPVLTQRFDTLRMANTAADLLRSWEAQRCAYERNHALVPMDRNLVARVQRVADYLYRRTRRIYG